MTTVIYEAKIDAAPDLVWAALSDFGNIYRFNPSVPASHLTSETGTGLGATRHCDLSVPGASIKERLIEWQEGESYKIEIYESKRTPPAKFVTAQLSVIPDGEGTIARMHMEYELKGGVLGSAMNGLMVKGQYEKAVSGLVKGLKHYIETGEEVEHHRDIKHHTAVAV